MIVWLNGPFGIGKTTTAQLLASHHPDLLLFDPELLGAALGHTMSARRPVRDFQDWAAWRTLTVTALIALRDELGVDLVVPQTVIREQYWDEILAGVSAAGIPVVAVTLHADAHVSAGRIDAATDSEAAAWRHARRADYDIALGWLTARSTLIDTARLAPQDVANEVSALLRSDAPSG